MTAQPQGVNNVLRAYVFVMSYGNNAHADVATIAGNVEEAEAELKSRHADLEPKPTFFNTAVAVMQPAIIEYWHRDASGRDVRREKKGYYAFLKGLFFCKCEDHQIVTHCKQVQTRTGWTAVIYGDDHNVRPL